MSSTYMTLDSRKRMNLASIATRDSYKVTRESNGRIILDPAVVLTEDELAVLNDPATHAAVEASAARGGSRPRRRL
ncbi:hypothetical protein [Microbacterium imperiale]|uniref:hypothetical protein n=1 Tax=Microbacterium imperiale TaxID=33884 RepID=UPI001AE95251|nr:hypothetical protein [Microbacterium imperiale]MBP2422202.1 hypothetical protein [Microbacterium imperiale]MDS0200701.1 hypothetical protein [Microbacterium imperiale]